VEAASPAGVEAEVEEAEAEGAASARDGFNDDPTTRR